jgi:hypothetical protein
MTRVLATALLLLGVMPALARGPKVPRPSEITLVPAQCVPERGAAGPCSTLAFASGVATLRSAKQPAPTCPRTGDPSENVGGDVRLTGVTRAGAPFTGELRAAVEYRTTFAADPNGTCALSGIQIELPSLGGPVACRNGRCKGRLVAIACLPKGCADTPIVSELERLVVKDDAEAVLAVPGTFVAPAAGDAP